MFSDLCPLVFLKWHFLSFITIIKVFNEDSMHAATADGVRSSGLWKVQPWEKVCRERERERRDLDRYFVYTKLQENDAPPFSLGSISRKMPHPVNFKMWNCDLLVHPSRPISVFLSLNASAERQNASYTYHYLHQEWASGGYIMSEFICK